MCGIVGLFLKDRKLEPMLGAMLSEMLITMTDRGPDSAGIAIYGNSSSGQRKFTVQSADPDRELPALAERIAKEIGPAAQIEIKSSHCVIVIDEEQSDQLHAMLQRFSPGIRLMSSGEAIEIYKETGLPENVVERFSVKAMSGSHGIGHTRMATESAVTTLGAHPFSTGADQCLVHNGSLSNHNNLRRELTRKGMTFETENDSEVAAAYLTSEMARGQNLGQALDKALHDLDGFFTFVVGTRSGFGVLRDPIACKPAVMAETGQYVAFGSEYRALAGLPDIENARIWEPEPATVYFWEHTNAA